MPSDAVRELIWPFGHAQVQRLGAMLAPVTFRRPGADSFSPLQVAPWADEAACAQLPGMLRRLRGEWPCVPFGRSDVPADLPSTWARHEADDPWAHGYASHHDWTWVTPDVASSASTSAPSLALTIEGPASHPIQRMTRVIRADPSAPALDLSLTVEARTACRLPIALHPTLRLDLGPVELDVPVATGQTYPTVFEPGVSRLARDRGFADLAAVPLDDGGTVDLRRFPLRFDTEELVQMRDLTGPVTARYLDAGWAVTVDWDRSVLPDLVLWISHRGRQHPPWNGRHRAIGTEPVNGVFELGRVARPPAGHPLVDAVGVGLAPDAPLVLRYRIEAAPIGNRMR